LLDRKQHKVREKEMKLTLKGIKERKTKLEKEFDIIKKQKEQTKKMLTALDIKMYRLQGKYNMLNDLEKEIK